MLLYPLYFIHHQSCCLCSSLVRIVLSFGMSFLLRLSQTVTLHKKDFHHKTWNNLMDKHLGLILDKTFVQCIGKSEYTTLIVQLGQFEWMWHVLAKLKSYPAFCEQGQSRQNINLTHTTHDLHYTNGVICFIWSRQNTQSWSCSTGIQLSTQWVLLQFRKKLIVWLLYCSCVDLTRK